ncbi:MAG: sterol desaturase family protein [Sandaracinaceae bacterium]
MENLLTLAVLGAYVLLLLWDVIAPARTFPRMRLWRLKGLLAFALYQVVGIGAPLLWDQALASHRLIDATGLGTFGGALLGLLVFELGVYGWHRLMHNVPFLWRHVHQTHHSAERVDVYGAFFFHPLDMLGFTLLTSVCLLFVVELTPMATVLAVSTATFLGYFQHANIRTPRWLGYLVVRPESHALHHERGIHRYNYADLPLVDMIFGTFRNPRIWEGQAGFYDGASERLGDLLLGRDLVEQRARAEGRREPEDGAHRSSIQPA